MATIFPYLLKDIESRIVYYMEESPQALVDLSSTSRCAYTTLSNSIFEQLFTAQYPLLAKTEAVFSHLKTYYSDCCWKVACCTMANGYTLFSEEFLKRALPSMRLQLDAQKSEIQAKKHAAECNLQSICGSFYADPNSPIHQAWQAKISAEERQRELDARLQMCKSNNDAYMDSLSDEEQTRLMQERSQIEWEILEILKPFSHDDKHLARFEKHGNMPSGLLLGQKRDFITNYLMNLFDECFPSFCSRNISDIQNERCFYLIDISLIKEYQKACMSILELKKKHVKLMESPDTIKTKQELLQAHEKMHSSSVQYQKLERVRSNLIFELNNYPHEMIAINKKLDYLAAYNRFCLTSDLYFAKYHEIITSHIDWLNYSLCVNEEELKSKLAATKAGPIILEMLYHLYANRAVKDKWMEVHFQEYRDEIADIVSDFRQLSREIEETYKKNTDLAIKCYIDKNIEAIKEDLPFLKEVSSSLKKKIPADGQPMLAEDITYSLHQFRKLDPFFRTLLHVQSHYRRFNSGDVREKLLPFLNLLINQIENFKAVDLPNPGMNKDQVDAQPKILLREELP